MFASIALMKDGEFDLIKRLFKDAGGSRNAFTRLGIGTMHQFIRRSPAWRWWSAPIRVCSGRVRHAVAVSDMSC